jgi:inorganic pyrophosphatase
VIEIGERVAYTGQVKQVKVLGVMALLDEGETDWKVIVIDVADPMAAKLNDIQDVDTYYPGLLKATHDWFRVYKIPDGKPENQFAFKGQAKDRAYALKVIEETHEAWSRLIKKEIPSKTDKYDICVENTQVKDSPYKVAADHAAVKSVPAESKQPAQPVDESGT